MTIHFENAEIRVVNETTGGEKGSKIERFDLLPVEPLRLIAKHFGVGASKYADRNWERGYDWSLSFAAMQRHAWAFWGGEDLDPETGTPHLAAVCFHAMALMEWARTHPELDNRPTADHDEPEPELPLSWGIDKVVITERPDWCARVWR